MKKLISVVLVGATLSACATAPSNVQPAYVSSIEYSNLNCDQIRAELMEVSDHVRTVTGQQAKDHTRDAVAMTVGIVIFWPALFFLSGRGHQEELAELKGRYDALDQAAIQKNCPVADEIREGQAKHAAASSTDPHSQSGTTARR
jgi:hypothetical protein